MEITQDPHGWTVTGDGYTLHVRAHEPRALLSGPDGTPWSEICLLASLDRLDAPDESYAIGVPTVARATGGEVEVALEAASTAWRRKRLVVRCLPDRIEVSAEVEGDGWLGRVQLLGGRAVLADGRTGVFRSSIGFRSLYVPTPTEPVRFVRPATDAAALGVVGDATPGRLHGVFSPPPLCIVAGHARPGGPVDVPAGDWLSIGVVAALSELRFTEVRYEPLDDGFLLELDYDGHTRVSGRFVTPSLVVRPASDPHAALVRFREDHHAHMPAPAVRQARPAWWTEPIFCGWGAQSARAARDGGARAADLSRQEIYDGFLSALDRHGLVPGTIVIDDRWQAEYGTLRPDPKRWPDLRGWIAKRHEQGQRVLLWWKAWDPGGLPTEECLVDPAGRPIAVDVASPAYRRRVAEAVAALLGPDGLDADGFKLDFTQRVPSGWSLRPDVPRDIEGPWGIAALHELLRLVYGAAKTAKPDALVITHSPHPAFADVTDMIRLNDLLDNGPDGQPVPAAAQGAFRRSIVDACLPDHPVDTDQWPIRDVAAWRAYVEAQASWGVPALYYVDSIDRSGEPLTPDDLALVAASWRTARGPRKLSS